MIKITFHIQFTITDRILKQIVKEIIPIVIKLKKYKNLFIDKKNKERKLFRYRYSHIKRRKEGFISM